MSALSSTGRSGLASRVLVRLAIIVGVCQVAGCSRPTEVARAAPGIKLPLISASSTDFGCLPSGSRIVYRVVKIRNSSNMAVHVSRWITSCECLSVGPLSIDVQPEKSTYLRLAFDPTKESDSFVGDLRISVEAFADANCVGTFDVPVSVVPPESLKHLDILGNTQG